MLKKLLEDELGKVHQAGRDNAQGGAGSSGGYTSTMSDADRKEAERARAVAAAADAADARGVSSGGKKITIMLPPPSIGTERWSVRSGLHRWRL